MQYGSPYGVAPERKGIATGCIVALVLAAVVPLCGLCAAIALPNYIKVKDKAKEAEVKANLHNIQLSVERFAVDHDGLYPNYLIGGEGKYATTVSEDGEFLGVAGCNQEKLSDALMRLGYLNAYPANPFTRNGYSIHQMQDDNNFDPLRNGGEGKGTEFGTRFGADCTAMGSVLAEMRFKEWSADNGSSANSYSTNYDVVYPFWDIWKTNKPEPFLPGQFFYKGNGYMQPEFKEGTDELLGDIFAPEETTQYMLGGYGSIRTKGKDVLGDEPQLIWSFANAEFSSVSGLEYISFAPWTRSDNRAVDGSPYIPWPAGSDGDQMQAGNPNGIRDALILILTAGEDYIGDR